MVATMPYRWVRGYEFPLPGTYVIDPATSVIDVEVRRLLMTRVQGQLRHVTGTIRIADRVDESTVVVESNAGGLHFHGSRGDMAKHAVRPAGVDGSDVIPYRSSSVRFEHGVLFIEGFLTVRHTAWPVALITRFRNDLIDDWSADRIGLTATARISRHDWYAAWGHSREHGGRILGKEVRLRVRIDALRSNV